MRQCHILPYRLQLHLASASPLLAANDSVDKDTLINGFKMSVPNFSAQMADGGAMEFSIYKSLLSATTL